MLIVDRGEDWLAITQPAHAWLSGELARAWGNESFAPPQPHAEVCLGIEQHDVAWTDWDLRPPLHAPAGRAAGFLEVDWRERLAAWTAAPDRILAQSRWAALVVALHGRNIHTRFAPVEALPAEPQAAVRAYLADVEQRIEDLIALAGADRATAERAGDLTFCLDVLSLMLCHGWPAQALPPVEGSVITAMPREDGSVVLDPWPLRPDRLDVHVDARRLTERFGDEAALHAALAAAPTERRAWTLVPPGA